MSDPTLEEKVKATFIAMLDYGICEKHGKANEDGCFICKEIRVAVEAEREGCCAAICTTCKRHGPAVRVAGYWKHILGDGKLEFFCSAAAIRARGEGDADV